jgi:hypothetical protein
MDALVDEAAHLPRKLGYAPKNAEIYPSDSDRIAARWVYKKYIYLKKITKTHIDYFQKC